MLLGREQHLHKMLTETNTLTDIHFNRHDMTAESHHYLLSIMPRVKPSSYNLRKETCFKPKINTMRFKNSFINRLVFKYKLAV